MADWVGGWLVAGWVGWLKVVKEAEGGQEGWSVESCIGCLCALVWGSKCWLKRLNLQLLFDTLLMTLVDALGEVEVLCISGSRARHVLLSGNILHTSDQTSLSKSEHACRG